MQKLNDSLQGDHVSLGHIAELLARDGIPLFLLILIIPNLCPIGIPIVSTVTGLPILVFIAQALMGFSALSMPHFLAKRSLPTATFKKVLDKGGKVFRRLERFIYPRYRTWCVLLKPLMYCLLFVYAVLLVLPIPGINFICAVYLCVGVLAIMEEDGLVLLIHTVFGVLIFCGCLYFSHTIIDVIAHAWSYFF